MEGLAAIDEEIKISELPQEQRWSSSLTFYNFHGFWYPSHIIKGIVLFQKNFVPQPNDILLCTTPKCGTTWLKALSFAILTRTRYNNDDSDSSSRPKSPLLSTNPHDLVPFVEYFFSNGKTRDPQNPLIHTHLPFSFLPKSVLDSNSKIIYICRDPKDVLVSHFFFLSTSFDCVSFEEAYETFCNGILYSGPYWDHVLEYWKVSLEYPERVLFLKYEDLKNDTNFYLKKIAAFMGYGFSSEEEKNGVVEKIIRLCSFENLSNLSVNNRTQEVKDNVKTFSNASYFRKGETGDWKNHLTPQMADRIDQITYQKLNPYGLTL